jgi:hypothetical protein
VRAGVYLNVLEQKRKYLLAVDPRPMYAAGAGDDPVKRAEMVEDARRRVRASEQWKRLDAGEPITVATWWIDRRRGAPDWLTRPALYGGAATVRVHPDDTITPATFYGASREDGTFEVIHA